MKKTRDLYRLNDILALATVHSCAKTPIIEFYPKARCSARVGRWYLKQTNFVRSDFIDHDMRVVAFRVEK